MVLPLNNPASTQIPKGLLELVVVSVVSVVSAGSRVSGVVPEVVNQTFLSIFLAVGLEVKREGEALVLDKAYGVTTYRLAWESVFWRPARVPFEASTLHRW